MMSQPPLLARIAVILLINAFQQVIQNSLLAKRKQMPIALLLIGLSLTDSNITDIWQPGIIGVDDPKRLRQFEDDVATADIDIRINSKDEIDIGIAGKSFTLDEMRRYFRLQRHKKFICVTYDKNAPDGNLKDSLNQLKEYFSEAGYKRILLMHSHSSGVIIREDYRPQKPLEMP